MEYVIVESSSAKELAEHVTSLLANGWRLQAGVSMCSPPNGFHFSQAMYRERSAAENVRPK
jgi:hypothetical protein